MIGDLRRCTSALWAVRPIVDRSVSEPETKKNSDVHSESLVEETAVEGGHGRAEQVTSESTINLQRESGA